MAYTLMDIINKETPPEIGAGGANLSACWLAEAQHRAGNTVHMASPAGSSTTGYRHIHIPLDIDVTAMRAAIPAGTDIVHLHGGFKQLVRHSAELGVPFIQTYRGVFNSSAQAAQMRAAGGSRIVHHGTPLQEYEYKSAKQDCILFLAHVRRSVKGVDTAIAIARQSKRRLIIAGGWRFASPATWLPISRYVKTIGRIDAGN